MAVSGQDTGVASTSLVCLTAQVVGREPAVAIQEAGEPAVPVVDCLDVEQASHPPAG